jgi:AraC-like DNA-binding protein
MPIRLKHDIWDTSGPGMQDMHYEVELGIVCKGEMKRQHDDFTINLKPGDIWLNGIWEPHSSHILSPPVELCIFHIYPPALASISYPVMRELNWLSCFTENSAKRPIPTILPASLTLPLAERAIDISRRTPSPINAIRMQNILIELLTEIYSAWEPKGELTPINSSTHLRLSKVFELVFTSEKVISFAQAVKVSKMNRTDFGKEFKNLTGLTFSRFALCHRLSRAAEALITTADSIKIIAINWGFTDASHFNRHFIRHYHMTPKEYRKQKRN